MGDFHSALTFAGILAAFIVITLILGSQERKRTRSKLAAKLKEEFGSPSVKKTSPERYTQIPRYHDHHRQGFEIDDITWNDLDLEQIFRVIDSTCSASGEEYLYHVLRTPSMCADELAFHRDQYDWFADIANEETRIRLQEILTGLGHAGRYSLYDYIDFTTALGERSNVPHYIAAAAPFAAFGLMFAHTGIGIIALLIVFAWNLRTYFKEKAVIAPYFQVFNYILRLLDCAGSLEKEGRKCPVFREETDQIPALLNAFSGFRRGSSFLLGNEGSDSDPFGFIMEYVRILFHLDLIKFNSMLQQMRGRQDEIDALLTITGRIDACISIASWRETLPAYAVPVLDNSSDFSVQDLYHPLLKQAVSNSITAVRPVLLTGSNASGKSTFLKAAALCALLSQTVGIAPAGSYRGAFYRIFTSMALRDSLQDGESYFIVEIKSLRRILDASGKPSEDTLHAEIPGDPLHTDASMYTDASLHTDAEGKKETRGDHAYNPAHNPVLCCIDEVLRGTNTVERIAASAEILRCFAQTKTLCFAATHDLELTGLLEDVYDNYHFSEQIVDGDVCFSYKLKTGPSNSCNAIALLDSLGYDRTLVEKARQRADRFLSLGSWQQNDQNV